VPRASLAVPALIALSVAACHRPAPPVPAEPEPATPSVETKLPPPPPTMGEKETMAALAGEGAQALAGLGIQSDVAHGASWFKGNVSPQGSTAYLYLGRLGEGGASTLRFVVRYQGSRPANLANCTVSVDGTTIGSFSPAPNRVDQPGDGSVMQLADIHFDDVRPIVLAMINGQTAVIRTSDGAEIRLGRAELDEIRGVLSAYLHLQGGAP